MKALTSLDALSEALRVTTGPRTILLTDNGIVPLAAAANYVDAQLARYSAWSIVSEPYSSADPRVWKLQRAREPRLSLLRRIDELQHPRDAALCRRNVTLAMWNQGWGSSFVHLAHGQALGLHLRRTFLPVFNTPWSYALSRRTQRPVCAAADLSCYFLPLSSCDRPVAPQSNLEEARWMRRVGEAQSDSAMASLSLGMGVEWLDHAFMSYVARPQYWLRLMLHERQAKTPDPPTPCAVLHVRRGDSSLHGAWRRRHHSVAEYVALAAPELSRRRIRSLLLMTDSSEALREAREHFGQYSWWSLPKVRFRGSEGGLHNHVASDDATDDVASILHELRVVGQCELWVGGPSHYGHVLWRAMCHTRSTAGAPNKTYAWQCPQRLFVASSSKASQSGG